MFLAFFTHHQTVQPRHLICPLRFVLAQLEITPLGGCDSALRRGNTSAPLELAAHFFGCAGGVI
jgi:hypothetical protein